jgi:hypothetical protein
MKRLLSICNLAIALHIFFACITLPCLIQETTATPIFQAVESQPLYRYRSNKGFLLYTTSAELPKLSNGPWTSEGIVCHIPTRPNHSINTHPVYQLSKSDNWGARYAYTKSFAEADQYKGGPADKHGIGQWMNQGEVFRVASDQAMNTVPLYRLYLPVRLTNPGQEFTGVVPGTDTHMLTTSESEKNNAVSRGWVDQGIIGYVWMNPYPPAAPMLPDLMVAKTEADEFSIRAFILNRGKANTKGIKFDVKLFVYDDKGKLLYQLTQIDPGMSPGQTHPIVFDTQGKSLYGKRYQVKVDTPNALEETNENNNETAMLEGPRRKIDLSNVDTERVIPPAIEMTGKQESKPKDKVMTIYQFSVFNWNEYPADWFQPLKSLDATSCDGKSTDARMLAHIWIEVNGNPPRKAGCKVLNSQQDFKNVQTFATGGAIPKPDKVFVVLEDRLAGKRYQSNSYPIDVFGIDKELVTVGCKRFLGRAASFICTKKLGFESCENLRKQGKPIECRMAGNQQ